MFNVILSICMINYFIKQLQGNWIFVALNMKRKKNLFRLWALSLFPRHFLPRPNSDTITILQMSVSMDSNLINYPSMAYTSFFYRQATVFAEAHSHNLLHSVKSLFHSFRSFCFPPLVNGLLCIVLACLLLADSNTRDATR